MVTAAGRAQGPKVALKKLSHTPQAPRIRACGLPGSKRRGRPSQLKALEDNPRPGICDRRRRKLSFVSRAIHPYELQRHGSPRFARGCCAGCPSKNRAKGNIHMRLLGDVVDCDIGTPLLHLHARSTRAKEARGDWPHSCLVGIRTAFPATSSDFAQRAGV